MRHPDIFAAILAGGRGARLGGADKALLRQRGATLLERLVAELAPAVVETMLCLKPGQRYPEIACKTVFDRHPGLGPLAGLEAALLDPPAPWCFLVACDMPALDARLLHHLAGERREDLLAVLPKSSKGLEPTCALYHVGARDAVRSALDSGQYALFDLIAGIAHQEVELPPELLFELSNVNTPADALRLLEVRR